MEREEVNFCARSEKAAEMERDRTEQASKLGGGPFLSCLACSDNAQAKTCLSQLGKRKMCVWKRGGGEECIVKRGETEMQGKR